MESRTPAKVKIIINTGSHIPDLMKEVYSKWFMNTAYDSRAHQLTIYIDTVLIVDSEGKMTVDHGIGEIIYYLTNTIGRNNPNNIKVIIEGGKLND